MNNRTGQKTRLGDGMRLLVCGGRHFDDQQMVENALVQLHGEYPVTVLIHGGLPALGSAAESWARRNAVRLVRYPANFSLGKRGDVDRDDFMLEDSRPDRLLAFPGGARTKRLVARAKDLGIKTFPAESFSACSAIGTSLELVAA